MKRGCFILLSLSSCEIKNGPRRSRMFSQIGHEMESIRGSNKFFTLKGDFSVKEMKQIAAALEDGYLYERELSDKLVRKLYNNGNDDLFE